MCSCLPSPAHVTDTELLHGTTCSSAATALWTTNINLYYWWFCQAFDAANIACSWELKIDHNLSRKHARRALLTFLLLVCLAAALGQALGSCAPALASSDWPAAKSKSSLSILACLVWWCQTSHVTTMLLLLLTTHFVNETDPEFNDAVRVLDVSQLLHSSTHGGWLRSLLINQQHHSKSNIGSVGVKTAPCSDGKTCWRGVV